MFSREEQKKKSEEKRKLWARVLLPPGAVVSTRLSGEAGLIGCRPGTRSASLLCVPPPRKKLACARGRSSAVFLWTVGSPAALPFVTVVDGQMSLPAGKAVAFAKDEPLSC